MNPLPHKSPLLVKLLHTFLKCCEHGTDARSLVFWVTQSVQLTAAESTGGSFKSQVRIPDLAFHFKSPFPLGFKGKFLKPFKIE